MRFLMRLLTLVMMVVLADFTASADTDKTIFVFADTHVMAPSLLDSPTNHQWKNDLANSKTMLELGPKMFDLLVEKTLTEKPDIVLIAGDLTKDGEVESHQYVRERLDKIKNAGIKVYITPGNHDRGYMDTAYKYENDTSTVVETFDNYSFPEFYKDYGFDDTTERFDYSMSYITEPMPGLTLISIDTGIWCWYREGTVDWVCQQAIEARKKGNQVLVMQHHPLMPHYYTQEELFELSTPEDYLEVRERFANSGIRTVLSGHTHASDICRYTSTEGHDIFDINCGCPISYPCDFRVLKLSGNTLKVTTRSLCDDMIRQDKDFAEDAEYRLLISVKKWAERWLAKRNIINDFFTTELAYCFVIHALGDEPENPDSSNELAFFRIIYEIGQRELSEESLEMLGHLREVVKSMLGDYQTPDDQYNIVKDRELTIDMSFNSPVGINEIRTDDTDSDEWYTLQGARLAEKPSHPGLYIHNHQTTLVK